MYSEKILDHFHHPRHLGEIERPTVVVEVTNPVCGDLMKLGAVVHDGRITEARFKTAGCIPAVACGSWLADMMVGKAIGELERLSPDRIEAALDGLPSASRHAAVLASDALKRLLQVLKDS